MFAYGGTNIPTVGQVRFKCQFSDSIIYANFIIVPLDVKTVLGLDSCIKLKFVQRSRTNRSNSSSHDATIQTKTDNIVDSINDSKQTIQTKTDLVDIDIGNEQIIQTQTYRADVSSATQTTTEL